MYPLVIGNSLYPIFARLTVFECIKTVQTRTVFVITNRTITINYFVYCRLTSFFRNMFLYVLFINLKCFLSIWNLLVLFFPKSLLDRGICQYCRVATFSASFCGPAFGRGFNLRGVTFSGVISDVCSLIPLFEVPG